MNKMETRRSNNVLRCVDDQGREHLVTQALEEGRLWTVHNTWSDWGTRQELLMLGPQKVLRLNATELRIESSGERLLLEDRPSAAAPPT